MAKNKVALTAGGPAGSGVFTIGAMFARSVQKLGLWVYYTADYASLIKGGHNSCYVRAEPEEIHSQIKLSDILVAIDKLTVQKHFEGLSHEGALIYDSSSFEINDIDMSKRRDIKIFAIPFTKLGRDLGDKIYGNIVAVGAVSALVNHPLEKLYVALEKQFGAKKGSEVVEINKKAAKLGYDYLKENYKGVSFKVTLEEIKNQPTLLLSGNEAACIGAIKAGVKLVAEYPMTPSSSILSFMAANENKYNIVVKHTEDEIAAMNMLTGAGMTGARCMTGTSGGGFALMTEAIGMAGLSETPCVIFESQRTGPSTGMPTYTEQSDLRFAMHASQGEFPRLIVAPGDVEEAFYESFKIFNLCDRVQTPGIVLLDKHLSESSRTVKVFDTSKLKVERGKLMTNEQMAKATAFKRYELTADGISPRCIPGQPNGMHVSSSYEHDETGWTTEESAMRIAQVDKRARKLLAIKDEEIAPKLYGDADADLTIVSWGSNKGMVLEAMKFLKNEGLKVNFLQILWVLPFPTKKVTEILSKAKKTLMVEQNHDAQMRGVIREFTGINIKETLLKYDGRPIDPEDIYFRAKEVLK
ncbi:MAG: 2-oxoacid:acceptor oxidoreductase subunit alpha [Nanoarchaeota archaeon]|nr:2-oxoacid:acceptor oxidoreductase subunit alpha [Nanoarchaeota archaeon]